jgi:hypothetical protein
MYIHIYSNVEIVSDFDIPIQIYIYICIYSNVEIVRDFVLVKLPGKDEKNAGGLLIQSLGDLHI